MDIPLGTIIQQKYRILTKIGEGASSIVYKAQDDHLLRLVALKFLRHELAALPSRRKRFLHEARLAARFSHKNAVAIRAVGEWQQTLFLVMDYHPGRTLQQILTQEQLSLDQVRALAGQLLQCLQQAHNCGLLHRDIKPANLLIDATSSELSVVDFGLGICYEYSMRPAVGTPSYMSPEQLLSNPLDQRSDLFSAAVCIYQMLTGKLPFNVNEGETILHAIFEQPLPPPSRYRRLPKLVDVVMAKSLAAAREERYESAQEFAQALESAFVRAYRFTWHQAAILLIVVIIVAGSCWGYHYHQRRRQAQLLLQRARQALRSGNYRQAQEIVAQAQKYARLPGSDELCYQGIWQEFQSLLARGDWHAGERLLQHRQLQHPEATILLDYLRFYYQRSRINQAFRLGKYAQTLRLAQNYAGPAPLRQLMQNQARRLQLRIQERRLKQLIAAGNFAAAMRLFTQLRPQLSPRQSAAYQRRLQQQQTLVSYRQAISSNQYLRAMQIAHAYSSSSEWRQRFTFAKSLLIKDLRLIKIITPAAEAVLGSRIINVTGVVPHRHYLSKLRINDISLRAKGHNWQASIVANASRVELSLSYHPWSGKRLQLEKRIVHIDLVPPRITIAKVAIDNQQGLVIVTGHARDNTGVAKILCAGKAATATSASFATWSYCLPISQAKEKMLFIAYDRAGNTARTTATITRERQPPEITVNFPDESTAIYAKSLEISGWISDASGIATLTVAGKNTAWSPETGNWRQTIVLSEKDLVRGRYPLNIAAEDSWGNRRRWRLFPRIEYFRWRHLLSTTEFYAARAKIWGLCYSPDSQYLVTAANDRQVMVLATESWRLYNKLIGKFITAQDYTITPAIRFISEILEQSSSRQRKHYWLHDEVAGIWRVTANELEAYGLEFVKEHLQPQARHLALSFDHQLLAIGYRGGNIDLLSREKGRMIRVKAHRGNVTAIAFSPDSKLLASGGGDCLVKLWDTTHGKLIAVLAAHKMTVTTLAFHKTGRMLASGSHDKSICLWSIADSSLICCKTGHTASVISMTFAPNGEQLASGAASGNLRIWEPAKNQQ